MIPIRILCCQLGLANPTKATNGLRKSGRLPGLKLSMQLGKHVFAPKEKEVPGDGDVPDARKISSCKAGGHIFNSATNTSDHFNERLITIVAQENKGRIGRKRFEMPKGNMRPINGTQKDRNNADLF